MSLSGTIQEMPLEMQEGGGDDFWMVHTAF